MTMQISSKALAIVFAISAGSFIPVAAVQAANPQSSASATQAANSSDSIVGVAAANPDFSTLAQAVQAAGLAKTLSEPGPFTVFAPTNEAFAALPPGTLQALLEPQNRDLLTQILTYHVVSGDLPSSQLRTGSVNSLNGPLNVQVASSGVTVNNATVTEPDVTASNGVIHAIDEVLVPQTIAAELGRRLESAQAPSSSSTTGMTRSASTDTTETPATSRTTGLQTSGTTSTTQSPTAGSTRTAGTTGTTRTLGTTDPATTPGTTDTTGTTATPDTTSPDTTGTFGTTGTLNTPATSSTTRSQTTSTTGTTGTATPGTTGTTSTTSTLRTQTTRTTETPGTTGTVRTQTTGTTGTARATETQPSEPIRALW